MSKRNNRIAARGAGNRPLKERLHRLFQALKITSVLLLMAVVGWGVVASYRHLDAPVELIVIKGDYSNVTQQELARWVEPRINGGMISLDLESLRAGMLTHPWVSSARVSRQWPGSLLIEIEEEVPVARWGRSGFLNSRGESLQIADNSSLQELPMLTGPQGWEREVMTRYREISAVVLDAGLTVERVEMSQRGSWKIALNKAPLLILGRDKLMEKIQRFLVVWEQHLSQKADRVTQLDLRYDNGMAVRWHQPEQV